ncbi:merozoite surface protein CMZ-8-like [Pangasianodon hypophthalmus]|uniref:merozoite surface protein CMZ-8-like n=1 Tax=Pangasianodon hypophthalmus TaxID=310915 RepID=UPI0023079FF2|nr:merozoite surface protein CMZ-8-like [Pangasianodon hypophthalmus]
MSSRFLLLVLLVLFYLQFFTTAQKSKGPDKCCYKYQPHPIPVRLITGYKETDQRCTKSGVIFTLKSGRHMCADPRVEWVQNIMKTIDKGSFRSRVQPEEPDNPVPPPSTRRNKPDNPVPPPSTRRNKPDNPVPPPVLSRNKPVTITEPVSTASTNIEQPDNPVPSPSTSRNKPDNPVSTASTNTEQPVTTTEPVSTALSNTEQSDKTHSPASSNIVRN